MVRLPLNVQTTTDILGHAQFRGNGTSSNAFRTTPNAGIPSRDSLHTRRELLSPVPSPRSITPSDTLPWHKLRTSAPQMRESRWQQSIREQPDGPPTLELPL